MSRIPTASLARQTDLWRTYEALQEHGRRLAMRKVRHRARHLSRLPRAVPAARRCEAGGMTMSSIRRNGLLYRGRRLGFRHPPAHPRRRRARSPSSELGLDVYPNQIEVITAEQMLDAYASIGMPLFYKHWSFGKHFAQHEAVLPPGPAGPRLRDRHQLQPLHHLHHGGEHGDDAGAGHRARGLRP